MIEKRYTKGDYTNCRCDVCEILKDNELYCIVNMGDTDKIIRLLEENEQLKKENEQLKKENEQLKKENEQLKLELQRIYDITTVNKVKNIVEEIYDDLLYETSEKSDYAREMILKCLEKIEGFGDDLE